MVIEYIFLLLISVTIILVPFTTKQGPIAMMGQSSPRLGMKVEKALVTGEGFFTRQGERKRWIRR